MSEKISPDSNDPFYVFVSFYEIPHHVRDDELERLSTSFRAWPGIFILVIQNYKYTMIITIFAK